MSKTLVIDDAVQSLTNKTLTSPKINEDVALTATASELNILDGATLSTAELNYVDGVTSAIQTQLDGKAAALGADDNYVTDAEKTKLSNISVTQAVDLDQMETDIAALANGMVYKGDWDASAGSFPGAGAAQTGWFYYVSVAGTVDGVSFAVGDSIVATADNASTTTYAANWTKQVGTDAVQSVAGKVGTVTLVASDITDFDAEVSNNTDVAANSAARHDAVTVTDSAEINFSLTGQDITASIVAGSIDEVKLDASVNASLDLADSALQDITAEPISDLSDVTITTVASGELLKWNGTGWVNNTLSEAGIAAASHAHAAADVTDFDTEVSNNTDVAANTAARHAALTVTDSTEIDFTLTGQDLTASLKAGSIDETKLDTSVNASLDLADSAVQDLSDLGITATAAELNYVDGVTSAIQTQLNGKLSNTGGTATGSYTFDAGTLHIDSTNNRVGIGTTGPGSALHIQKGTAASDPATLRIFNNGEASTNQGDVYTALEFGVAGAENGSGNLTNGVNAAIKVIDTRSGASKSFEDAGLGFFTTDVTGGLSQRLTIDHAGNVGINTTNPGRKIDIIDASNPQLRLTHTAATDYADFQVDTDGNIDIQPSGSGVLKVDGVAVPTVSSTSTLTNKRLTSPKINEDVALTATATEINNSVGGPIVLRDLDDTGATDVRSDLAALIAANAGKKLILPKGAYKLDLTTDVTINWSDGTTLEGEGNGTVLQITGTGIRNLFGCNSDTMVFRGFKIEVLDMDGGTLHIWRPQAGGNDLIIDEVEIDFGVVYSGGSFNWTASGVRPLGTSDFTGFEQSNCKWYNGSRAFLRTNTDTGSLRGFKWHKNRFSEFYRAPISTNSPSGDFYDVEITSNSSRNNYARTTGSNDIYHFGLGSGKQVRCIGNDISGEGDGINVEESAVGLIIANNTMQLSDTAAHGVRLTDANIGTGSYVSPRKIQVIDNNITGPGKATATAHGIWTVNDATAEGPVDEIIIAGNLIEGFDRGIALDDDVRAQDAHNNVIVSCATGIWSVNAVRNVKDNSLLDCDIGLETSGTGTWGEQKKFDNCTTLVSGGTYVEQPKTIGMSGVAVAHTGDTALTVLATLTLPANSMGAKGYVDIEAVWSYTNSANAKTLRISFGGTTYYETVPTTTQSRRTYVRVYNRGATNSQVGGPAGIDGYTTQASAPVTSSVDTTADVTILIRGQLANSGETITLESYDVKSVFAA